MYMSIYGLSKGNYMVIWLYMMLAMSLECVYTCMFDCDK